MKQSIIFYFSAFVLLVSVSSCNRQRSDVKPQSFSYASYPGMVDFDTNRLQRIDTFLQSYIDQEILPNAITFVARHGKIVHNKTYGWKDKEAGLTVQKDDIFRLASQTKAITTVALLTLFEKGYFLMDDPVSKFIPEFKNPQVLVKLNEKDTTWIARPARSEILIRHLLNHTSGISSPIRPVNLIYAKYNIPGNKSEATLKEVIPVLATLPLTHDPGEGFTYGLSTDVAGYLIEVLSGKDLDEFLKEELFEPLGMNNTFFNLPSDKKDKLVKLYEKPFRDSKLEPSSWPQNTDTVIYFSGAGGLYGTIEDYARFCQMLLNGGEFNDVKILSRKTIEMMTRNQIGDLQLWNGDKFGYGFEIIGDEVLKDILGSEGSFRWAGMYSTDYLIDPKEDIILLLFTNVYPFYDHVDVMYYSFRNLVYQAIE
jgi:CubicO group peptidase (beta-lactamase class C family)